MITNERQYRITKRELVKLKRAIVNFNLRYTAEQIDSDILVAAEIDALKSEMEILEDQIIEYENLISGTEIKLSASSLTELPKILIQARIAQHFSQRKFAELIGLKEQQIQRYEAEEYRSASLTRLLEIANALHLNVTEIAEISPISRTEEGKKQGSFEWAKFPVVEMYKRGWFEGFYGSLDDVLRDRESLLHTFLSNVNKKPVIALHHKRVRSGSEVDQYALLAWESRILSLELKTANIGTYRKQVFTSEWITNLIKLSRFPDGPLRARAMLQECGIALIIEPHLVNTYIDGAALLYGESPVIGMTLRYDRIDNFWFVLIHELIHITKHLQKGKIDSIFDDLEAIDNDKIELEADMLAREALIPSTEWNFTLARYLQTDDSVKDFAHKLDINPAIVAGRIRYESNNYLILHNIVGQGEVRKLFSEVNFGT
jgi:HTH-type transcriptional regulator / antitoxin HigA